MLQLTIAGNIGKDAEAKQVGGSDMCSFPVAASTGYGNNKKTVWVEVTSWGKGSQSLAGYIRKGDPITVTGEMSTREYDGKTYIQVRADRVELQGKGGERDDRGSSRSQSGQSEAAGKGGYADDLDDNIPFD